jgi:hypothetical protein
MMNRYDAPPNAASQCGQILRLLQSRAGGWTPLPEILALKISQYGTRIKELRDDWGYVIESKTETVNGQRHSWFRLRPTPMNAETDWYEREHGARPRGPTLADGLPLFRGDVA